jgi:hypothetical protein
MNQILIQIIWIECKIAILNIPVPNFIANDNPSQEGSLCTTCYENAEFCYHGIISTHDAVESDSPHTIPESMWSRFDQFG